MDTILRRWKTQLCIAKFTYNTCLIRSELNKLGTNALKHVSNHLIKLPMFGVGFDISKNRRAMPIGTPASSGRD